MQSIWMISHLVQWLFLILLAFALLRIKREPVPSPAAITTGQGFSVGSAYPNVTLRSLEDAPEPLIGTARRKRIILFTLKHCPVCDTTYPEVGRLQDLLSGHPDVELTLVTNDQTGASVRERFAQYHFRFRLVYFVASEARPTVPMYPYAIALDEHNVVRESTVLGTPDAWHKLLRAAGIQAGLPPAPAVAYVQ